MTPRRRHGDTPDMSEFQVVEALLRQQQHFLGERFDQLDARLDRLEERQAGVESQVRLTNGTVLRHTDQLAKLESPDPATAPLMTRGEGALLRRAVGWSISVGGALYVAVRWLVANWSHLVPATFGMMVK